MDSIAARFNLRYGDQKWINAIAVQPDGKILLAGGGSGPAITRLDTDGLPGSFSNAEQDTIQSVWQRVAEDYSVFDIDVTTEEPLADAIWPRASRAAVW